MKNIVNFIIEKLIINKHSKIKDSNDYWYDDIEKQGDMKDEFYNNRKLKHKTNEYCQLKNRPWFAIYLYLLKNGASRRDDIVKALWNKNNNLGRLFSDMTYCGIIYSNQGKATLSNPSNWTSRYTWKFNELMGIKSIY